MINLISRISIVVFLKIQDDSCNNYDCNFFHEQFGE